MTTSTHTLTLTDLSLAFIPALVVVAILFKQAINAPPAVDERQISIR